MYCPKCRAEYREGFTECSDCRVRLVWELPPEPEGPWDRDFEENAVEAKRPGDPNLEWAQVFEGDDPLLIGSAKDLLERAGIPFYVQGEEYGVRHAVIDGYTNRWCRISVGRDREAEARAILEQFAEIDSSSDRPE